MQQTPVITDPAVDELAALERDIAPFEAKFARAATLRSQLRRAYGDGDTHPANAEIRVEGTRAWAILGPRANASVIDYASLVRRIRAAAFCKFATCTLQSLARNVTPEIASAVVSVKQIGPRTLRTYSKEAA